MTAALRGDRRSELLDAADRVVRRDGPLASMTAMATEAGITKPILYRHFGDKSGLYAALADRHTTMLLDRIRQALATPSDRRSRVRRTIEAYLAVIEDEPEVYRFLVHRASSEDPAAADRVAAFVRRLGGVIGDGIAAELQLPADEHALAGTWGLAIVGMVQAAGDQWLEYRAVPRAELAEQLTALLWGAYASAV